MILEGVCRPPVVEKMLDIQPSTQSLQIILHFRSQAVLKFSSWTGPENAKEAGFLRCEHQILHEVLHLNFLLLIYLVHNPAKCFQLTSLPEATLWCMSVMST